MIPGLRHRYVLMTVAILAMIASHAPAAIAAPPDIHKFLSNNIKTLQLDSHVVSEDRDELQKIGSDFANAYRLHNVSITYAQPGKLHIDTTILGAHLSYTINGNTRYTSAPTFHIHQVEDVSRSPGKKNSLLDSGLVPPELLDDWDATYLRKEGGEYVFQLIPKQKSETFKNIIWIDPKTHITTKRLNYDRHGKLSKWFLYKKPQQVRPGVFIPTEIDVYNAENKLAAVTAYTDIHVNLPVDMSVFNF